MSTPNGQSILDCREHVLSRIREWVLSEQIYRASRDRNGTLDMQMGYLLALSNLIELIQDIEDDEAVLRLSCRFNDSLSDH